MNLFAVVVVAGVLQLPLPPPPLPPLPCPPPLPCLPPVLPPPPHPPPGVSDDPPTLSIHLEVKRTREIVIEWEAKDDIALVGFRLYVDGWYHGRRGPKVRRATFRHQCGRHHYRVEAVDSALQRTSRSLVVRRRC